MSGKELLVDTNIVIYLLNKDDTIAELLRHKKLYISFITELELFGIKGLSEKDEKLIENFLKDCHTVEINGKIKQQYKKLRKNYNLKLADCIIAATSIAEDIPLLSADKQLKNIKELDLLIYNI